MKKILITILFCLLVLTTGCSSNNTTTSTDDPNTNQPNQEDVQQPKITSIEDAFAIAPQFEFDEIGQIEAFSGIQETTTEGYPQQWKSHVPANQLACYFDDDSYTTGNIYTSNSIIVRKGNLYGIYDYEGNELYPISIDGTRYNGAIVNPISYDSIAEVFYIDSMDYILGDKENSRKVDTFAQDFKSISSYDIPDGLCGNPEYLAWYNGNICKGYYTMMEKPKKSDVTLDDLPNAVLPYERDDTYARGSAIITNKNVVTFEDYMLESFVNNMVVLYSGTRDNKTYAIYNHDKKMLVTNFEFEDIKYYMEGYIPCKKDGKWGFLDEDGNVVIDYLFDDASSIYNGKAWVSYNGLYGVLDINKALELKEEIPAPLGTVKVLTKVLKVRDAANADNSTRIGNVHEGDVISYYEVQKDDNYTWYRISNIGWIADDGELLEAK